MNNSLSKLGQFHILQTSLRGGKLIKEHFHN